MIRLLAWVLSVIYLIVLGIPTAIGLLIILQILSIFKFISNVRKKRKKHNSSQLPVWFDYFPDQSQDPIY
jgi:1,4-dihydroxy-2-naphthoate octaprenyltransferase